MSAGTGRIDVRGVRGRSAPSRATLLWGGTAVALILALHKLKPERFEGSKLILTPVLVVGALLVLRWLWRQPPSITLCAGIAATVFSNGWSQLGLGGLPLDRVLVVLALLQIVCRAPGARRLPPLQLRSIHLLLAAVILYLIGSAAGAGTLTDKATVLSIFDEFGLTPFLAFLAAPSIFASERDRRYLLVTLVGLGFYLGLTAVFEALGPHSLIFPGYIVHIDAADPAQRVNGPFQSSVAEGCGAYACAVGAVIAVGEFRSRPARLFALVTIGLCGFACFGTLERGVWIGAAAGTVVAALMTRAGRRLLVPGIALCAVVIGGALLGSSQLAEKTSARAGYERSVWDRQNQTSAGIKMVEAKPLFGFGVDRYKAENLDYFRQSSDYPLTGRAATDLISEPEVVQPLHDLYLGYMVELGLVGFLLWFASLVWGVGGSIFSRGAPELRPWKLGLLAISVFFLLVTVVNPNQPPFTALLLWTWAGVAAGRLPERAAASPRPPRITVLSAPIRSPA